MVIIYKNKRPCQEILQTAFILQTTVDIAMGGPAQQCRRALFYGCSHVTLERSDRGHLIKRSLLRNVGEGRISAKVCAPPARHSLAGVTIATAEYEVFQLIRNY